MLKELIGVSAPQLALIAHHPTPVLAARSPDAEHVRYGFEGGRVIRQDGEYHLFTTEMLGDPLWVATALAHWTSADGLHWTRVSPLRAGSADYTGDDPRAALWSPMPIYDEEDEYWNLFYVAYRAAPDTPTAMRTNHEGRIWRARSTTAGRGGLAGPYTDLAVVLEPGPRSDSWEGLQGTDSFFPYRAGSQWYALYGSARTERLPIEAWQIGLATAPHLGGPWTRCSERNPLPIEPRFIENPVVTQLPNGAFIAVYDTGVNDAHALGWAWSPDGVTWERQDPLRVPSSGSGGWVDLMRTPLGLVLEADGRATIFYTGYQQGSHTAYGEMGVTCAAHADQLGVAHLGVLTVEILESNESN